MIASCIITIGKSVDGVINNDNIQILVIRSAHLCQLFMKVKGIKDVENKLDIMLYMLL